jgi:hypothetical protein
MIRSGQLQAFLDQSERFLRQDCTGPAAAAADRLCARWTATTGAVRDPAPGWPTACAWLEPALAAAATGPRADLAKAFSALAPDLSWKRRSSARPEDAAFWNGHANATIIGPGGLEERDDLWVGASVLGPRVDYVDHDHPPEEVYLSLSPGEWWNAEMDWTDPGPTGAIYNPPGILHRMRAVDAPFLALWYLPV